MVRATTNAQIALPVPRRAGNSTGLEDMLAVTGSMKGQEERDKKVLRDHLPQCYGWHAGQCLVLRMTCSPHMYGQPLDKRDPIFLGMLIAIVAMSILYIYFLLTIPFEEIMTMAG